MDSIETATTDEQRFLLSEQEALQLLAFLVTSARGLMQEPKDYGPKRLLEATKRLSNMALPRAGEEFAPLLSMLAEDIPIWKSRHRQDPEGYVAFIDECCRSVARELKSRDLECEV